jgi:hypothetical protein
MVGISIKIKLLSGDMIVIDVEDVNIDNIKQKLRNEVEMFKNVAFHLIKNDYDNEEGDDEKKDSNGNNGDHMFFAFICPIHPYGKEFETYMKQYGLYLNGMENTTDGELLRAWSLEREDVAVMPENCVVAPSDEMYYYFNQIPLFFEGDDGMRGDSIINTNGDTAIELFAKAMIKGYHAAQRIENNQIFRMLLKTTDQNILIRLTKMVMSSFSERQAQYDNDTLDDFFEAENMSSVGAILSNIGLHNAVANEFRRDDNVMHGLYGIFDDIKDISIDEIENLKENLYRDVSQATILSILKLYISSAISIL